MITELEGSFRSHANWLRAFATLAGFRTYPIVQLRKATENQREVVLASQTLTDAPVGKPNVVGVKRSLANAWGTELLLTLSGEYATEDELVRLANNWGSVQTYYVAYHAFQAYLLANGESRPESHPQTQRMFAARWARRTLSMPPWTFAASSGGFLNGPPGRTVDLSVHQWTACDASNAWDIAGHALKSTRDRAVPDATRTRRESKRKEAKREWDREEADRLTAGRRARTPPSFPLPRLSVDEREDVLNRLRPYTPMDYLYRLRIKSNYEDSTMFTDGPTDDDASQTVHRDLVRLASSILFLHELHVLRLIGRGAMTRLADEWIKGSMPADRKLGVAIRRDILLA
jgi:hypothetical protein